MSTATITKTYPHTPNYIIPVPPGEILEEKLGEMGMTAEQFAEQAELPLEQILLLFKGAVPLTPGIAVKLEAVTEIPVDNWDRYERRYRDDLLKAAKKYGL